MTTILCWGELLWDLFPDGPKLGGAPTNVAFHLATIGARVALVSRVGDDEPGRRGIAALAARGVDIRLLQLDPERATGAVEVTLVDGEPRFRLVPGSAWERIQLDQAAAAALSGARAFCFGTLSQRTDEGLAAWRAALAALPASCLRICDPNLRPGHVDEVALLAALEAADVIKLNDREVALIARRLGVAAPDLAATLLARGARCVAITRGAHGSALHTLEGSADQPGIPARPHGDTVGCGDAFTAVLAHGLLSGWPLPRLAAAANRYAAEIACHRGATPVLSAAEVADLLSD